MRYLLITTFKNESPYVLEWLAYHQHIGFTDFLIYTNDCTDGTDFLLDRLDELGHIHHQRNDVLRRGPQKSALKWAKMHELYAQADWVLVSDIDEFLNIKLGNGKVSDLTEAFPDADAIPVTWRMFSENGQVQFPFGLTIEAFSDAEPVSAPKGSKGRFVKTLFKPSPDVERLGTHQPIYEDPSKRLFGRNNAESEPKFDRPVHDFGYEIAQMNHYAVRSVDAYLLKRDRGRVNHTGEDMGLQYWQRWNKGGVKDTSIQAHLPAVKARIEEFLDDPETAFLCNAGIALSEKRLAEIKAVPDMAALRETLLAGMGKERPAPKQDTKIKDHTPVPAVPAASPDTDPRIIVEQANNLLKTKAPGRHKNRQAMLATLPKGGVCAEIGVWSGGFSAEILSITQPQRLYLIDPWDLLSSQEEDEWTHNKHNNASFMRGMFDSVTSKYGELPSVEIRKGFSAEVLSEFPDDYFDWVYIDGNHLFEFVKKDVEISFQKVKSGGIIAGDDFFWKKDNRTHVKEGVESAMQSCGIDRGNFSRMGQQFLIEVSK